MQLQASEAIKDSFCF